MEQFGIAAWRHFRVAENLEGAGELDDAGYHFGMCGENAIKHLLREAGVEAQWISAGAAAGKTPSKALKPTPMRQHLPQITSLSARIQVDMSLYATGRFAAPFSAIVLHSSFLGRFAGWHVDIRYADSTRTPVTAAACTAWRSDAEELLVALMV